MSKKSPAAGAGSDLLNRLSEIYCAAGKFHQSFHDPFMGEARQASAALGLARTLSALDGPAIQSLPFAVRNAIRRIQAIFPAMIARWEWGPVIEEDGERFIERRIAIREAEIRAFLETVLSWVEGRSLREEPIEERYKDIAKQAEDSGLKPTLTFEEAEAVVQDRYFRAYHTPIMSSQKPRWIGSELQSIGQAVADLREEVCKERRKLDLPNTPLDLSVYRSPGDETTIEAPQEPPTLVVSTPLGTTQNVVRVCLLPDQSSTFDLVDLASCRRYPPTGQGLFPRPEGPYTLAPVAVENGQVVNGQVAVTASTWIVSRLIGKRLQALACEYSHASGFGGDGTMADGSEATPGRRPFPHELYCERSRDRWFLAISFNMLRADQRRYYVELEPMEVETWLRGNGYLNHHSTPSAHQLPPLVDSTAQGSAKKLAPCIMKAYGQWKKATEHPHMAGKSPEEVYDWLADHREPGDELPTKASWCRYVRAGRHAHGESTNTRRAGRAKGSSIVERSRQL